MSPRPSYGCHFATRGRLFLLHTPEKPPGHIQPYQAQQRERSGFDEIQLPRLDQRDSNPRRQGDTHDEPERKAYSGNEVSPRGMPPEQDRRREQQGNYHAQIKCLRHQRRHASEFVGEAACERVGNDAPQPQHDERGAHHERKAQRWPHTPGTGD